MLRGSFSVVRRRTTNHESRSTAYDMSWQLAPPKEIEDEVKDLEFLEFDRLASEVGRWITEDDYDDLALAHGIKDKGYSEEFSWWALKEIRMRVLDQGEGHRS